MAEMKDSVGLAWCPNTNLGEASMIDAMFDLSRDCGRMEDAPR